jgi:hypothetical protein
MLGYIAEGLDGVSCLLIIYWVMIFVTGAELGVVLQHLLVGGGSITRNFRG